LRILLHLYMNALVKGNPVVVAVTVIGLVALSMGPFSRALSSKDPVAIGIVAFVTLGILFVLAIAIIDRRSNAPKKKRRRPQSSRKRSEPRETSRGDDGLL
jgi:hypothetical protein